MSTPFIQPISLIRWPYFDLMSRLAVALNVTFLIMGLWSMPGSAQPWLGGCPAGTKWSPNAGRHPVMPPLDSLFRAAPDARTTVLPAHGGVNREGRPVWGQQVRRVHRGDTTKAYTGWTRQILVDSDHRWRFQRFERGWLVEQVSYYENGTADHHFHTDTTGNNIGSQRMWHPDGQPYLDQFHDAEGRLHGRQLRWTAEGTLDWDARFEHGVEVDDAGVPVPEDRRSRPGGSGGC